MISDILPWQLPRVVVSDFRSLRADIVSEGLSACQSPAAKIPFLAAGWSLCFSESSWPCHPGQRCVERQTRAHHGFALSRVG